MFGLWAFKILGSWDSWFLGTYLYKKDGLIIFAKGRNISSDGPGWVHLWLSESECYADSNAGTGYDTSGYV